MRIPIIRGIIERRILANFHADPDVIARILPPPFRPQVYNGFAIAGICLIRLASVRPKMFPLPIGIRSENAAHRIAVEWDADGQTKCGVFIPRRDTNSRLNTWAGGTLFPGIHHYARFATLESSSHLSVAVDSADDVVHLRVSGSVATQLPNSSAFPDLPTASQFFANGALGYSITKTSGRFDGIELQCEGWKVDVLELDRIESSFFDDSSRFPKGSIGFDCALLMRDIRHEWHGKEDLCCSEKLRP